MNNNKLISFIVIGKNEESKLANCFLSIIKSCENIGDLEYEIIYVDSNSSDNSIDKAKEFHGIQIFHIYGKCNAAVARNIGAKESIGEILFFIDGDMQIECEFLSKAIVNNNLKYNCLTGHIDDWLYDKNGKFLTIKKRTYHSYIPNKEIKLKTLGGIFLIKRDIWDSLKGMRTKYARNEDHDLSYRLEDIGIEKIRLPYLITKHHTIDYNNQERLWETVIDTYAFYPAMLFRDHITKKIAWMNILRSRYTSLLLISFLISFLFLKTISLSILIIYLFILSLKVLVITIKNKSNYKIYYYLKRFSVQIVSDILFSIGFLVYYPKEIVEKYYYNKIR